MVKATTETKVTATVLSKRDPGLEKDLDGRGLQYNYVESVPPGAFDTDDSMLYQSRQGEIDRPTIDAYKLALKKGDALPAILSRFNAAEKLVVVAGLHRLMAYSELDLPLNTYVVEADRKVLYELMVLSNVPGASHGLPTNDKQRLEQAAHLVDNGMPKAQAAAAMVLSESKLNSYFASKERRRKAVGMGVKPDDWDSLKDNVQSKLIQIHTQEGFQAMVALCLKAGLNIQQVSEHVDAVNSSRSGETQAAFVADLANAYANEIRAGGSTYRRKPGQPRSPRAVFETSLTSLIRRLDKPETLVGYYETDAEVIAERIDDAMTKLRAMKRALNNSGR